MPNEPSARDDRLNLAIATYLAAVERGEAPDRDKFLAAHGDVAAELQSFFANQSQLRRAADLLNGRENGAPAEESADCGGQTDTFHAEPSSAIRQPESVGTGDVPVLPTGTTIGRYIVERCLGRGGFGAVYLARDEELQRSVAVKVPRLEKSISPQLVERMLQEVRTVAQLQHPGIVSVFDSGRTPDGNPYFVMEYVAGRSLADLLESEKPNFAHAVRLVADIADATHFLHLRHFVHRDLKPGNVLIGAEGRPRLTDFGMAVHETEQRARAGERVGTLPYMSPELLRGETHRIDGRTDIWSLGVILYRLLTGRLPFRGDTPAQLVDEILNRDPKPLRQIDDRIPAELETVCLKCLSKDMTSRYTTAADVAGALRAYLEKADANTESLGRPVQAAQKRIELKTRLGNYGCSVSMAVTVCLLVVPAAIMGLSLVWLPRWASGPLPPPVPSSGPASSSLRERPAAATEGEGYYSKDVFELRQKLDPKQGTNEPRYEAENVFELLDADKNGEISEEEFDASILARLIFKNAFITPTFPVSREEFIESYTRQKLDPKQGTNEPNSESSLLRTLDQLRRNRFDEAIRLRPGSPEPYQQRGEFYAAQGELSKAAGDFGVAFSLAPRDIGLAQTWSYLLFSSGNIDEFRDLCAELRERFPRSGEPDDVLILARILILDPEAGGDRESVVRLAQKALFINPQNWWCYHVLSGALIRNAQFEDALQSLDELEGRKLIPAPPGLDSWLSQILNDSLRAIALLKLERTEEARAVLGRVATTSEEHHLRVTPQGPFGDLGQFWWNWYPIQAFRHEAEELLREAEGAR
jgi:serine/threonine protein kinase